MPVQQSLFYNNAQNEPLANRVRPGALEGFIGQRHLLAKGKVLLTMIENDSVPSMIFWGPPGVGKTTLARIIARRTKASFINFSAVTSGIKEIKEVMRKAEESLLMGERTILFVDEIHRFNKAQQDAFLPYVERGSIILIGATTENPSFEVNAALLSRCKVFVLHALKPGETAALIRQAIASEGGFPGLHIEMEGRLIEAVAEFANGDARAALNTLEMLVFNGEREGDRVFISEDIVKQCIERKALFYDKGGEEHYNIISALHKSMRVSDVNAALYWLARMLEAGENPLYIARRIVRFASEDIGMADSSALHLAVASYQACHYIGMPECSVHLAHAVIHMSLAPKSRAADEAYAAAKKDALTSLTEPVPMQIRNAPTPLMRELGYGEGYQYMPGSPYNLTCMQCLPDALKDRKYYHPTEFGREANAKKVVEGIESQRSEVRRS